MAILPDYLPPTPLGKPINGSGSSGITSTLFTMWTDATTASSDCLDPSKMVYGAGDDNNLCKPIVVPSMGFFLELNLAWYGTAPTADRPIVAVFGELDSFHNNRNWPQDNDANLTQTSADGTAHDSSIWIPLVDWDSHEYQTDNTTIDASNLFNLFPVGTTALDSDGGDAVGMRMGVPRRVSIYGVKRVIVTVQTAADNATAAMIVGRFIG